MIPELITEIQKAKVSENKNKNKTKQNITKQNYKFLPVNI